MDDSELRPRVVAALQSIIHGHHAELPNPAERARLVTEMTAEVLGLGPLQELLEDRTISEVMVVDPETIYVEKNGTLELTSLRFMDSESCRAVIERIVTPLGRRIDESTPLVDARLPDGSRVNAVIPPLAIRGPCITIRKFARRPLQMSELVSLDALSEAMATFLCRCVRAKKNVIISGGTGSGKTTLLNVLSTQIPAQERIVTIEDAAELQLDQPHVVCLESKPRNLEGRGEYTIRDLLRNALRMRPDRILVGECRGGEAIDMLQAMNTGHEGSMTTTHANSPREAMKRIETLCMMAGLDLSTRAVREQIASSIHIVVQQMRFSDGTRRITSIAEVDRLDRDGELILHEIFSFHRSGAAPNGTVRGKHRSTGYVPSFLDEFIALGLVEGGRYL
jgi:pilus assembly protein CpaF